MPFVPTGPLEISHGQINEELLNELLVTWYSAIGDKLISPEMIIRDPELLPLQAVLRKLPVVENGRINIFWLKAYLRRVTDQVLRGYMLIRISTFDAEMWAIRKADTP